MIISILDLITLPAAESIQHEALADVIARFVHKDVGTGVVSSATKLNTKPVGLPLHNPGNKRSLSFMAI